MFWLTRQSFVAVNSLLLDFTGILFACQLVILLIIGPFADYGNWRPWILISASASFVFLPTPRLKTPLNR